MFYPVSPRLTVFLLCFCVFNFSLRVNKSCNCSASCPAAFHLLLFYSIIFFAFRIIARAYSCTMYINPRLAALCALLFNSFTQLASVCVCARVPWDISHIKVGQAMARDRHRTIQSQSQRQNQRQSQSGRIACDLWQLSPYSMWWAWPSLTWWWWWWQCGTLETRGRRCELIMQYLTEAVCLSRRSQWPRLFQLEANRTQLNTLHIRTHTHA